MKKNRHPKKRVIITTPYPTCEEVAKLLGATKREINEARKLVMPVVEKIKERMKKDKN